MSDKIGQEKIMQRDHTRNQSQQPEHVLVKLRIAEMIKRSIDIASVRKQPSYVSYGAMLIDPGIVDAVLGYHNVNVIVFRKGGQQFGAVIGDAGAFRR